MKIPTSFESFLLMISKMSLTRMNGVDEVVFLVTVAATLFIYFRNKSLCTTIL